MTGLLIDSCGAVAQVALCHGADVVVRREVAGRDFSARWVGVLRELLGEAGWVLSAVEVLGVVSGPGSFTGVRVGMAAAKGLCEATGAKLVAVSRLELMSRDGVAVLDAGRDQFYLRDGGVERLVERNEMERATQEFEVVTEDADLEQLAKTVMQRWSDGAFDNVQCVDANYVRSEKEIYARKVSAA